MKTKTEFVHLPRSIRTDPDLSENLRAMAEEQHRSVANLIGLILIEAINKYTKGKK